MPLNRRRWLTTAVAAAAGAGLACRPTPGSDSDVAPPPSSPLRTPGGDVDWRAVRELFPLEPGYTHLAAFLFVSHPRPVSDAIDDFRRRIDADPTWIEVAATTGPYAAIKAALAGYLGGQATDVALTSNTTSALAMAYHGLRIRPGQEILTTTHDHYSHHESIRYAAQRSGALVRYVDLYDESARATADEIVDRLASAITPATRAVGVTWVHSSTGVKLPVARLAEAVAAANRGRALADRALLIVDGVHGFGNQDIIVADMGCDFFAAGLHKWMLGPRGTGILWGRGDAWPALRPTIPSFDPDGLATWSAWMDRAPLPPTEAAFVSPGGFLAYEYFLAIPAAVQLHGNLGRDRIAARISELNTAFREQAAKVAGLTLHTPRDPAVSAGLSCFEIAGVSAVDVASRLAERRVRTNSSPYRRSLARVSAGIMNGEEDIDTVLGHLRALAGGRS
jgi:selenocysteine lyase/cysteine desulfurase